MSGIIYHVDIWASISKFLRPIEAVRLRAVNKALYELFNISAIIANNFKFICPINIMELVNSHLFKCFDLSISCKYNTDLVPIYNKVICKNIIGHKQELGGFIGSNLPNITSLNICYYDEELIKSLPNLVELSWNHASTRKVIDLPIKVKKVSISNDIIEYLPISKNLESLVLCNCNRVKCITSYPKLKHLSLSSLDFLPIIPVMSHLESLTVSDVPINLANVKHYAPNLKKLEILTHNVPIDAIHINHIKHLKIGNYDDDCDYYDYDSLYDIYMNNIHMLNNVHTIVLLGVQLDIDCSIFKSAYNVRIESCYMLHNIHELKNVNNVYIGFHNNHVAPINADIFNGFKNLTLYNSKCVFDWENLVTVDTLCLEFCKLPKKLWPIQSIRKLTIDYCENINTITAPSGIETLCLDMNSFESISDLNVKEIKLIIRWPMLLNNLNELININTIYLDLYNKYPDDLSYLFDNARNIILINMSLNDTIGGHTVLNILNKYKNVNLLCNYHINVC